MLNVIIAFAAGFFVCWWTAKRRIMSLNRDAALQVEGAKRLRIALVDFCEKNNITIRPWDVPPFSIEK